MPKVPATNGASMTTEPITHLATAREEIKAFYKAKTFGKVTPGQIAQFEGRMKLLQGA